MTARDNIHHIVPADRRQTHRGDYREEKVQFEGVF